MDNKNYYDFFDWGAVSSEGHKDLLMNIIRIIPEDVDTILDVGCGNGIITNALATKYRVTGVDRSETALSYLQCEKIQASCEEIPVENESFDLVLSTELLEHLEDEVLAKTIEEFKRISRKYILITVPFDENIKKMMLKCPECGYIYNRVYHLRSFSYDALEQLLPGYSVVSHTIVGKKVRKYNKSLSKIKLRYTPSHAWIPFFWIPGDKRQSMCPNCEHTFHHPYKFNFLALALDLVNVVISPKKPYWQAVLFRKAEH